MKCTKCEASLEKRSVHGIEVDACPQDHGMWLDASELDRLEDKGYDEDELKGSLVFRQVAGMALCPHCSAALQRFQYRLNELHLDYCPGGHGYWLDAGEDVQIVALMNKREDDLDRAEDAEGEWEKTLERLRSKSLVTKMQKHMRRRAFLYKLRNLLRLGRA